MSETIDSQINNQEKELEYYQKEARYFLTERKCFYNFRETLSFFKKIKEKKPEIFEKLCTEEIINDYAFNVLQCLIQMHDGDWKEYVVQKIDEIADFINLGLLPNDWRFNENLAESIRDGFNIILSGVRGRIEVNKELIDRIKILIDFKVIPEHFSWNKDDFLKVKKLIIFFANDQLRNLEKSREEIREGKREWAAISKKYVKHKEVLDIIKFTEFGILDKKDVEKLEKEFKQELIDTLTVSEKDRDSCLYDLDNFRSLPDWWRSEQDIKDAVSRKISSLDYKKSVKSDLLKILNLGFLSKEEIQIIGYKIILRVVLEDSMDNLQSVMGELKEMGLLKQEFVLEELSTQPEGQLVINDKLVYCVRCGQKNMIEKIKEIILPNLDIEEFVRNQYQGYINEAKWNLVVILKSHFPECDPIFQEFIAKQKEIAKDGELSFPERKIAVDILAELAENGEATVAQEFSEIISARTKQKEIPESKWGLDQLQEGAFYTLMRLDNSNSNCALFGLMFGENVNSTVKYAILKKLLRNDSNFLNSQFKENLHDWLYSGSPKKADWRDLQFIGEIQKIPSKELRDKSLKSLLVFKSLDFSVFPLYKTWSEKYNNIPQNVFLQILELDLACESEGLLDKFQKLFTSIRKESSKKDSLLYGITNVLETDPQILKLLGEKLSGIDFGSKQDADSMSELLRRIVFLNRIENIKNYQDDEDDRYERDEDYEEQE